MNKYRNKKVVYDNIIFDSKAECERYIELKLLLKANLIGDLQMQKKFELIPKTKTERAVVYIADFYYIKNGDVIVEDVKGIKTKDYIIKRKLLKWIYPDIKFIEITKEKKTR